VRDEIFFEVGLRIAALRGEMTQTEFADQLDVDRKTVGQWERGERVPAGTQLIRMSEEFSADINFLLTGQSGGAAPSLRPDEEELLANYRAAHSDARERIRQISATAAKSPKRSETKASIKVGVLHGQYVEGNFTNHGPMTFGASPPAKTKKPSKS